MRRPSSAPTRLAIDVFASPIGQLNIVSGEGGVCAIDYGDFAERMRRLLCGRYGAYELVPAPDSLGVVARLKRYFDGELDALDALVVDGAGTPYQRRVWAALRAIPPGRTCTYGELAVGLGATHARAVGHANALNPIAIVVPCHRVIGASAALTGYAGGLARKRWLLDHEARHAGVAPPLIFSGAHV